MIPQSFSEHVPQDALGDLGNECKLNIEWEIDEEFKNLIIPHSEHEKEELEKSILKDGCRDMIILWDNKIIDGHLRYEICKKHGKRYKVLDKTDDLNTREDVKDWMIRNQLARRNLPREQYLYYIGKLYNERKGTHGGDRSSSQNNDMKTSEIIAKEWNTSSSSVERAGKFAEVIDKVEEECGKDYKDRIIKGNIKLSYDQVKELSESENIKEVFEPFKAEEPKKKVAPPKKREQKKRENKSSPVINKVKCPHCGEVFCLDKENNAE